jgi:hypothetical protein
MGRICLNLFVMKIDLKPNEMVVKASNSTYLNGQKINGKLILNLSMKVITRKLYRERFGK